MKLKWKPALDRKPLQQFGEVVRRRNRLVHPRPVAVGSASKLQGIIRQLRLDAKAAHADTDAVRELIRRLSLSWRGSYGPDWLDPARARRHPPCLILGPVDAPARLGRGRRKRPRTVKAAMR
jgi:hypothetical protein